MLPVDIAVNTNHATVDNLVGFSIVEDSGASAKVEIRKAAVAGQVLVYLNLSANESATIFFPSVPMEGGTYVKEVSGSVTGVLFRT